MLRETTVRVTSICFLVAMSMVATIASSTAHANIFGNDDRQPVLSRDYPWRCIGVVVAEGDGTASTGTGFLVGRNLVLTNAHCTQDEVTGKPAKRIHFFANRIDGVATNAVHVNRIWRGTDDPRKHPEGDWAVLRLDSNLGDDLGWLPLSTDHVETATIVGYSGDYRNQQTAASAPCFVHEVQTLPWLVCHDGDTTRGSSGGPLIALQGRKSVVIALNFGELRDNKDESLTLAEFEAEHTNLAISVASFRDAIEHISSDETTIALADGTQLARKQVAAQEFEDAYATLSRLISLCPASSWALLLRAQVANALGRRVESSKDYQQALMIDPNCLNNLLERAYFCLSNGRYLECISLTDRIIQVGSSHIAAMKLRETARGRLRYGAQASTTRSGALVAN